MKGRPPKGGQKEGHRREPTELVPAPTNPIAQFVPPPPPGLDDDLCQGWYVIVDDLMNRGRTPAALREVDLEMVRQLLEAVWTHRQATETLHIDGINIYKKAPILDPVTKEPTGEFMTLDIKQHPAVKTQREASATYLRLAETLAITPMARVRAGLMMVATKSLAEELGSQMAKALAIGQAAPELPEAAAKATAKKPATKRAAKNRDHSEKQPTKKRSTKKLTKRASGGRQ